LTPIETAAAVAQHAAGNEEAARMATHISYEFDPPTVDLILEGLSHLPHRRVASVMEQIRAHAVATLNPPPPKKRKRNPKAAGPAASEGGEPAHHQG
jgi:hypothetical protein